MGLGRIGGLLLETSETSPGIALPTHVLDDNQVPLTRPPGRVRDGDR